MATGPVRLIEPDVAYAGSFVAALCEGFRRGNRPVATMAEIADAEADPVGHLARRSQVGPLTLPDGREIQSVSSSIHWLVEGRDFVGELSFRHALNDVLRQSGGHMGYGIRPSRQRRGYGRRLLAEAKTLARTAGIDRLLLTCHDHNEASARIIEANGGVLEDVVDDIFGGGPLRRYWIDLEHR
ncbi:MAG: GNAT family N-acetyltransferase [Pseudomonadota bacterium]